MNYWSEMRTKFGFNDGSCTPPGLDLYREAYILAVNAIAAELCSTVRAVAYDRPGMHNWCLILFYPAKETAAWTDEQFTCGDPPDICEDILPETDDEMVTAIEKACEMRIDDYLTVRVSLAAASRKQLVADAKAAAAQETTS